MQTSQGKDQNQNIISVLTATSEHTGSLCMLLLFTHKQNSEIQAPFLINKQHYTREGKVASLITAPNVEFT